MNRVRKKLGFTLIELLVVIGIIALATSIILSVGGGSEGQSLSASQRILSGIVKGARGQAILKSAEARLIIHNDPNDLDKYRRYIGIIYRDSDGTNEGWVAASQGTYLPQGIFFDASGSATASTWSPGNVMNIDYPKQTIEQEGGGESYYYYSFNSNGTAGESNAWMILRAATMIPSGDMVDELRVTEDQEYLRAALILRRSGTTTLVDDPNSLQFTDSGGSLQK